MMRYLAIDYGSKRTGLAICDRAERVVSPLQVLPSGPAMMEQLKQVVGEHEVEAIVLGLPLNMNGSVGDQARMVQQFASELAQAVAVPIELFDERLSTFAAEDKLSNVDLSHKQKRRRLDAIAAAAILESFLQEKQSGHSGGAQG